MSLKIALVGNPNSGKTTLFNALTGANQYVGNWPGVTVEKKEGKLKGNKEATLVDLPGIYSLSPYTLEEVVARNFLLEEMPDAIINIVDGTNIERNLYLSTQILELGIPVVMAINMMDVVEKNGDLINIDELNKSLGCKVIKISALKGKGIKELSNIAIELANISGEIKVVHKFDDTIETVIKEVEAKIPESKNRRFVAIKLLERDSKIVEHLEKEIDVDSEITVLEKKFEDDTESIITNERYNYITSIIENCVIKKAPKGSLTTSDKIDKIVTSRILGLPIFAAVMFLVYYISITTIGGFCTDWVNDNLFGKYIPNIVDKALNSIGCADWLYGLIQDGIVAGVGAVLGFVPQILVLFICLAFLEGCGYMARVAFVMDRVFRKFGLSGKSFIPMLIGTGCGVPGIMASRTIENERDRRMTVMTTTFIPCSAKLPIIALIAGAFFDNAGWVSWSAYFVGVSAIIVSGIILKKTKMFAGKPAPFVMELPSYHFPTLGSILRSMWERGYSFIKKAGTIILLSTIFVWFTTYFGWVDGRFQMLAIDENPELIDGSLLSYIGNGIAWIFKPLGFGDWKSAVAAITGLIAKENVVGTFGILFHFGEVGEEGAEIWAALRDNIIPIAAYAYLVFNLLCAPCFAAMGAIKREMNNIKWFWFAIGYQCIFAYLIALCVYQLGGVILGSVSFGLGTISAIIIVFALLYLIFRPAKKYN